MKRICQAMTVEDFAAFYGHHPVAVRRMCAGGILNAEKHGRIWIIYDEFAVSTTTVTVLPVNVADALLAWAQEHFPERFYKKNNSARNSP